MRSKVNEKLLLILGRYETLSQTVGSLMRQLQALKKEAATLTDDEYMSRRHALKGQLTDSVREIQSIELYALIIAELKKMEEKK